MSMSPVSLTALRGGWPPMAPAMPAMPLGAEAVYGVAPGVGGAELGPVCPSVAQNGTPLLLQQTQTHNQSTVSMFIPLGPMQAGLRTLMPALLLQGSEATKQRLNEAQVRGFHINVATSGEKLLFSVSGPHGQEPQMLDLALGLMTRPNVDPWTFYRLKEDTLKMVRNSQADPLVPLGESVLKALYGVGHPYAKSSQDVTQELAMLSLPQAQNVWQQAIGNPAQARIMMVSPLPVSAQAAVLNNSLVASQWTPGPYAVMPLPVSPPIAPARGLKAPILVPNETVQQAFIMESWRAPQVTDPDYPAFCLMFELLRGVSGSFFKVLRTEKGLVYGTDQAFTSWKHGGDYSMSAQVPFDKIGPTIKAVQEVIDQMIQRPVSDQQLQMARKKFLLGLNDARQSPDGVAMLAEPFVASDVAPLHPDVMKQAANRVTSRDIQRVASRFLNTQSGYQVIGVSAPQTVLSQWFGAKSAF